MHMLFGEEEREMVEQCKPNAPQFDSRFSAASTLPLCIVVSDDLSSQPAFELASEVTTDMYQQAGGSFLSGVLLLDMQVPGCNATAMLLSITCSLAQTHILLFIVFEHRSYYLLNLVIRNNPLPFKDRAFSELVLFIRVVPVPSILDSSALVANPDGLTDREVEVVQLVGRGMVVKEVARALVVSEKTIRNHLSSIYRRLNLYDRSQIVIYALQHGLVTLPRL